MIEELKSDKKSLMKKLKKATTKSLKLKSQKDMNLQAEIESSSKIIKKIFNFLL